uniref:Uncharacterized protein n=1 Tax=Lepeophtheirus salmonis TaxID=72036 RepID=A0A0K2SXC6_LEPSM
MYHRHDGRTRVIFLNITFISCVVLIQTIIASVRIHLISMIFRFNSNGNLILNSKNPKSTS